MNNQTNGIEQVRAKLLEHLSDPALLQATSAKDAAIAFGILADKARQEASPFERETVRLVAACERQGLNPHEFLMDAIKRLEAFETAKEKK